MIEVTEYDGQLVPKFITEGFHSQYIQPVAQKVCKGYGLDIGCGKEHWKLPGSFGIDLEYHDKFHAMNLPDNNLDAKGQWDYIFSSHCLEHLPNYVETLRYWTSKLKTEGTLFLYLPHHLCKHWRPYHSKKHIHQFYEDEMHAILNTIGYDKIFISGVDLAYSFAVMGEKI